MKTITVKLDESLARWLSTRARALGRPQSELVREALEQSRKGGAEPSCHDVFADVCGSVEGPKGISTNPKYLTGFGE